MNLQRTFVPLAGLLAFSVAEAAITTNTLPTTASLPATGSTTRGFVLRSLQGPAEPPLANNSVRALRQINGTLTDTNGVLVPNEAIAGSLTRPVGAYSVDTINFVNDPDGTGNTVDVTDIDGNLLTSFPPAPFPGIPGTAGGYNNFAVEVVGFLKLPAGVTVFGTSVSADRTDVNDDDSYAVYVGANPRDFFATKVGEYERNSRPF